MKWYYFSILILLCTMEGDFRPKWRKRGRLRAVVRRGCTKLECMFFFCRSENYMGRCYREDLSCQFADLIAILCRLWTGSSTEHFCRLFCLFSERIGAPSGAADLRFSLNVMIFFLLLWCKLQKIKSWNAKPNLMCITSIIWGRNQTQNIDSFRFHVHLVGRATSSAVQL